MKTAQADHNLDQENVHTLNLPAAPVTGTAGSAVYSVTCSLWRTRFSGISFTSM